MRCHLCCAPKQTRVVAGVQTKGHKSANPEAAPLAVRGVDGRHQARVLGVCLVVLHQQFAGLLIQCRLRERRDQQAANLRRTQAMTVTAIALPHYAETPTTALLASLRRWASRPARECCAAARHRMTRIMLQHADYHSSIIQAAGTGGRSAKETYHQQNVPETHLRCPVLLQHINADLTRFGHIRMEDLRDEEPCVE